MESIPKCSDRSLAMWISHGQGPRPVRCNEKDPQKSRLSDPWPCEYSHDQGSQRLWVFWIFLWQEVRSLGFLWTFLTNLHFTCFATLLFCCSFCAALHRYSLTSLLPCFENIFHNQQSSLAPSLAIPFFATSLFCCSLFRYSLLLYLLTLLHPCFITAWFTIPLLHCTLCFTAPLLCCALASLLPCHHFKYLWGLPLLLQSPLLCYFIFGCFLSKSILPISPSLL